MARAAPFAACVFIALLLCQAGVSALDLTGGLTKEQAAALTGVWQPVPDSIVSVRGHVVDDAVKAAVESGNFNFEGVFDHMRETTPRFADFVLAILHCDAASGAFFGYKYEDAAISDATGAHSLGNLSSTGAVRVLGRAFPLVANEVGFNMVESEDTGYWTGVMSADGCCIRMVREEGLEVKDVNRTLVDNHVVTIFEFRRSTAMSLEEVATAVAALLPL